MEETVMRENQNLMSVNNHDLEIIHKNKNSTHYNSYYALPVKENRKYHYPAIVKGEKVPHRSVIATLSSSGDVVENATRYGNNASNGRVLSLRQGSEIETTLEIPKASNYSIELRAKRCETCTFLSLEIDGDKRNNNNNNNITDVTKISNTALKDNTSGLNWLTSNTTYLKQGTYKFKIYSDSKTHLDSVVIYPKGNVIIL